MTKSSLVLCLISICIPFQMISQEKEIPVVNSLLVYASGYSFGIVVPQGWSGNTKKAEKYGSHVIFHPSKQDLKESTSLIQIADYKKSNEKSQVDLEAHLLSTHQNTTTKEKTLTIQHQRYNCCGKLLFKEGEFYRYTIYVNPGEGYKTGLAITMNLKREASKEELDAMKRIVSSLRMLKG